MSDLSGVKALVFDVGGTVVDWHEGISSQLAAIGKRKNIEADWVALTKAWRTASLQRALGARTADLPRGNIDGVHREMLDKVLSEAGIDGFDDADREAMTLFWHHLDPWPDAAAGHARLRKKFTIATLTILSISAIVDLSRRAPFHWDAVISCEMLEAYKLDPSVYRHGTRLLALEPNQVMMVAAHDRDLIAARAEGMRTAFIHRPREWGEGTTPVQTPDAATDIVAGDLNELADRLGA